jgi:hypothetical protein
MGGGRGRRRGAQLALPGAAQGPAHRRPLGAALAGAGSCAALPRRGAATLRQPAAGSAAGQEEPRVAGHRRTGQRAWRVAGCRRAGRQARRLAGSARRGGSGRLRHRASCARAPVRRALQEAGDHRGAAPPAVRRRAGRAWQGAGGAAAPPARPCPSAAAVPHLQARACCSDLEARLQAQRAHVTPVSRRLASNRSAAGYTNYGERLYVEGRLEALRRDKAVRARGRWPPTLGHGGALPTAVDGRRGRRRRSSAVPLPSAPLLPRARLQGYLAPLTSRQSARRLSARQPLCPSAPSTRRSATWRTR